MLRVGTDIGGTFTDVTVFDEEDGTVSHSKVLTSARHEARGVVEALDRAGISVSEVAFFSHGTTIAINAIIERKGARTAILTTDGMRDVLEMRQGSRTHILDPLMDSPYCFVPGRWRLEVDERLAWDGSVTRPLDEHGLRATLRELSAEGIQSLAVVLLHSYVNPAHERRIAEIVEQEFDTVYCSLSSDLVREVGEYERTSTAAINAYVGPPVRSYLGELDGALRDRGLGREIHVMKSSGGIMTAEEAVKRPIEILESGPAAGCAAAAYVARLIGVDNAITLDIGGTTAKASVIEGGEALTTLDFSLFGEPDKPGSGWPIQVRMIDIVEVGSGGGSVAWVDADGRLQVGPESAGADPGPVCYGRGGTRPTITDGHAVLGTVRTLVGGELMLDVEGARVAIATDIAQPLGLTVERAAVGILELGAAKVADLIREVTIARGRDPRDFVLVAYGGAGPLEAATISTQLGMSSAVIPPVPGTLSAFGLLCTDLIADTAQAYFSPLADVSGSDMAEVYADMEQAAVEMLRRQGVASSDVDLSRRAELRYKGQFHLISVPLPPGPITGQFQKRVARDFNDEHLRLYTYKSEEEPLEVVNLRVRGVGRVERGRLRPPPAANGSRSAVHPAAFETRQVYFRESTGRTACEVFDRTQLEPGARIVGPAIVEETTSTTLVPPGFAAAVDAFDNLLLSRS